MAQSVIDLNERKHGRTLVKHPLDYEIGGINLKGIIVNASSQGVMVKSSLSLDTAFEVFRFLDKEPSYRTVLEFSFEGEIYVAEAEIKHFHLDSSPDGSYGLRIGFGFHEDKIRVSEMPSFRPNEDTDIESMA